MLRIFENQMSSPVKQFIAIIMSFCTFSFDQIMLHADIGVRGQFMKYSFISFTAAIIYRYITEIVFLWDISSLYWSYLCFGSKISSPYTLCILFLHFPIVSCSLHTLTFRSGWNACPPTFRSTPYFPVKAYASVDMLRRYQ